jgi:hypothetical protein
VLAHKKQIFFIYWPKASGRSCGWTQRLRHSLGIPDATVPEFSVRGFDDSGGPSTFQGQLHFMTESPFGNLPQAELEQHFFLSDV